MSIVLIIIFIILGILGLLFLITLHELAHFLVAKLSGAYVYEFALGFGPRLWTYKGRETWFSIRLLPLGGYVYLASDKIEPPKERENEVVPDERKLENIARWKRFGFIAAGPLANLLAAIFLTTTVFMATLNHPNDMNFYGQRFESNGIAAHLIQAEENKCPLDPKKAWSLEEVVIVGWEVKKEKIGSDNFTSLSDDSKSKKWSWNQLEQAPKYTTIVYSFLEAFKNDWFQIKVDESLRIQFTYKQMDLFNGQLISPSEKKTAFSEVGQWQKQNGKWSVGIAPPTRYFKNIANAYGHGLKQVGQDAITLLKALGQVFKGNLQQLSGPVGIAKRAPQTGTSASNFFLSLGSLSANLFMLNFLPVPPLDGYKFFENAVEAVIKRELNPKVKYFFLGLGLACFAALFIAVTIKDIFGG